MSASDQIFLVMDAGSPVAAFTARHELKAFLQCRLDTFINPLVYTLWDNQGTPSIMTMSAAMRVVEGAACNHYEGRAEQYDPKSDMAAIGARSTMAR
jgi:hypothetical protein